jgi:MSHA pilin protein MshA
MNLNYSGCAVKNNVVTTDKCVQISACTQVGSLMQGGVPSGYNVAASGAAIGVVNGGTGVCSVTKDSQVATFTGISAGNP